MKRHILLYNWIPFIHGDEIWFLQFPWLWQSMIGWQPSFLEAYLINLKTVCFSHLSVYYFNWNTYLLGSSTLWFGLRFRNRNRENKIKYHLRNTHSLKNRSYLIHLQKTRLLPTFNLISGQIIKALLIQIPTPKEAPNVWVQEIQFHCSINLALINLRGMDVMVNLPYKKKAKCKLLGGPCHNTNSCPNFHFANEEMIVKAL